MQKEKLFKVLSFVFMILTFIGAFYIFVNKGEANPGYAIIPSLFSVIFSQLSIKKKR